MILVHNLTEMGASAESAAAGINEQPFFLIGSLIKAQAPLHVAVDKLPQDEARLTECLAFALILANDAFGDLNRLGCGNFNAGTRPIGALELEDAEPAFPLFIAELEEALPALSLFLAGPLASLLSSLISSNVNFT